MRGSLAWLAAVSGLVGAAEARAAPVDELRELGLRVQREEAARVLGGERARTRWERGEIPAVGSCERPTEAERAALRAAVAPGVPGDELVGIAYGCKEPSGIIVDVAFDRVAAKDGHRTGVWRVVKASTPAASAKVSVLAQHEGTSQREFMEFADEVTVHTQLLVDVDGDGVLDAEIARAQKEGGSLHGFLSLRLWRSRARAVVELGTYSDSAWLVEGTPGGTFVLMASRFGERPGTRPGTEPQLQFRCVLASGKVEICPAVAAARRRQRKLEIAEALIEGRATDDGTPGLPDRDWFAALAHELELDPGERDRLARGLSETRPGTRVAREIRGLLAPSPPRTYGEITGAPTDLRPSAVLALLGDAACLPPGPMAARRLEAWIARRDAALVAKEVGCVPGKGCAFARAGTVRVVDACFGAAGGHVFAEWDYALPALGDGEAERIHREAVFWVGADVQALATATARGLPLDEVEALPRHETLSVALSRRGARGQAVVWRRPDAASRTRPSLFVDAAPGATPLEGAERARLFEPDAHLASVLSTTAAGRVAYWHFDGARWEKLVELPETGGLALAATASPAARWFATETARSRARQALAGFDPDRWASDPAARAQTRLDLVAAGAGPELLARIDAQARQVGPKR